jgi:tRNA (mo5U34)-methyltransferase
MESILERIPRFQQSLNSIKASHPEITFYPYGTIDALYNIEKLLAGSGLNLLDLLQQGETLDIGGSDGDLSFFLDCELGVKSTLVENANTQHNGLTGFHVLREELGSSVELFEANIDRHFVMPKKYHFVFFLGILYHLKNPYNALECIGQFADYCLLSTRIARCTPGNSLMAYESLAYLLDENECNNDSTNYWIFSVTALQTLFSRTGWEVVQSLHMGNPYSNPRDNDKDERYWCLLKRKR